MLDRAVDELRAQGGPCAHQAALHGRQTDAELGGGGGAAQAVDVAQHQDLAIPRFELAERVAHAGDQFVAVSQVLGTEIIAANHGQRAGVDLFAQGPSPTGDRSQQLATGVADGGEQPGRDVGITAKLMSRSGEGDKRVLNGVIEIDVATDGPALAVDQVVVEQNELGERVVVAGAGPAYEFVVLVGPPEGHVGRLPALSFRGPGATVSRHPCSVHTR